MHWNTIILSTLALQLSRYGATSPMKNLEVGKDTLNCYAINSNSQRFGGPLVVESATLVTDTRRTNRTVSAALMNALAGPPTNLRFALSWCSIEARTLSASASAFVSASVYDAAAASDSVSACVSDSDQVWDVTFAPQSLAGWDLAQDPAIMCDVTRFTARGAAILNTTFHHTTCNLGRMKASDSLISDR